MRLDWEPMGDPAGTSIFVTLLSVPGWRRFCESFWIASDSNEGSDVTQHYEATPHRTDATPFQAVQSGNQAWWTSQTMSYDWGEKNKFEKFSLPWYDEIDRRFAHDARLFAHDKQ